MGWNNCKNASTCGHTLCFEKACQKYEPKETTQKTNADRIRAMSDAELAGFIIHIAYDRGTMWCEPFSRKFCDNCPTTECTIEETGITMDLHECDFSDGVCPHGSDVMWWLKQPAKE